MSSYIKIPCKCECHSNNNIMHMMPCCDDNGYTLIPSDYIKELSMCGLSVKLTFNITNKTEVYEYSSFEEMQKCLNLDKQ